MEPWARPKVLLLGDSITQQSFSIEHGGFGAGLTDYLYRTCDCVNRGYSGYNTRWARWLLPRAIPTGGQMGDLAVCTIFFGANDSVSEGETQHVPLGEYKENLLWIIQYLRSVSPETFIVLLSPPTVNTKQWPTRSPSVVSEYANVCRELYIDEKSRGSKIALLDLGHLTEEDLRDGLHLNRSGNLKVFNLLKEFFEKTFPQLIGESTLQPHYPLSSSFSGKSVEELKQEITEWTWGVTLSQFNHN